MTPAANHLLRALYLHALAPSTANQDAVRAAGAALDTETARALNAPKSDTGIPVTEQNQGVGGELKIQPSSPPDTDDMATMRHIRQEHRPLLDALAAQPVGLFAQLTPEQQRQALEYTGDELIGPRCGPAPVDTIVAEVRADLLARSGVGIAKYGVTLDRRDLGLREWLVHFREELMDGVLYATRALRGLQPNAAPVEPPHAAEPVLRPLTPEPAEAVLGRAGEALAWDGRQPPVWVEFKPGVRHPYGDAAFHVAAHVAPDGKARLFPSKAAANVWLCANGTVPV